MRRLTGGLFLVFLLLNVVGLMAQSDDEDFTTTGELRVIDVLPTPDSSGINGDTAVVVIFNRPVVPLGSIAEMRARPSPITIEPAIDGTGEWINTSIYTFQPELVWGSRTTYTVTVRDDLQAIDGATLDEPVSWSFETTPAYVISTRPDLSSRLIDLDERIQIVFNTSIDADSLESAFFLRPIDEDEGTLSGAFEWTDNNTTVRFTPDELLTLDTTYHVGFPADAVRDAIGTGTVDEFIWEFSTVPYPAVISSRPEDGEQDSRAYYGVSIGFNTNMNLASFNGLITIDPEPAFRPDLYFNTWDRRLSINFEMWPSTDYTITLDAGAEDIYGNVIEEPFTFSFRTAPSTPFVRLQADVGSWVGFYNANRSTTQVFVTHLNVSEIEARLYRISMRDFVAYLVGRNNRPSSDAFGDDALLKTWQIPSVAPENFVRYELLEFGTDTDAANPAVGEGALMPGIYGLRVSSPETGENVPHYMVVGTANILMKVSPNEVIVWVTDIESGQPLIDVPVVLYQQRDGETGYDLYVIDTDEHGIARAEVELAHLTRQRHMAVVDDGENFGVGFSTWASGIDPWNFGVTWSSILRRWETYVYTDRPIYRPDQPVYIRGIIRQKDDVTYTRPSLSTAIVNVSHNNGDLILEREVNLTPFGSFDLSFDLDPDAALGSYRVTVIPEATEDSSMNQGWVFFRVAEYRLPEFQVMAEAAEDQVAQGDTVRVMTDSAYFFGGKVVGANVDYTVMANPYFFSYRSSDGRYDFYEIDYDAGPGDIYGGGIGTVSSGSGTTDDEGRFLIEVPANLREARQSQRFTIEATVRDESDQSVSARTSVIVHQGELYIGARPQNYIGRVDTETAFDFIAVDWSGLPIVDQVINVEIVERRWSNVQEEAPDGRTVWNWTVEQIPVESGEVTTDAEGRASMAFTPPRGGTFKAIITTQDERGNTVRASTMMWVTSRNYVSWRQQNSNRIDLVADSDSYEIGDTAEILITSPFQGAVEALITVERGGILLIDRLTLESNSAIYQVPIIPEYAPNIFVSVFLVKGVDEHNPVAGFRMGTIALDVNREQKIITIEIEPDMPEAGPGDTVTYTVRTTDYTGAPIVAEVGVALTDLAALSIAEPNSDPIVDVFYGPQALAVYTSTTLTINVDQVTQTILDTIKGGGGGFGDGGIFDIREDFIDTAYWQADLVTGEDGTATFSVTLPDNLTTWRLDARAITSGDDGLTLVGQDTFDLISTRPLLIRPITPRFFTIGDEVNLLAVVNNNTNAAQTVEVAIEGTGVILEGEAMQTVVIPAGGSARIQWPVTVEDVNAVDLTFFARTDDARYTDASKPPLGRGEERLLPVYHYEVPEIVGTGGLIRSADTRIEGILIPQNVERGELSLNIEPSLAATTLDALAVVRNWDYQSTESTVSRLLSNVTTYRALDLVGLVDDDLRDEVRREVEIGVQRLAAWQKADGGWGWLWREESNLLTTAYAVIGLTAAQEAGFTVDRPMIARAQNFLNENITSTGSNITGWQLDRNVIALYALAYSDSPNISRTVNHYEARDRLSIYAQALLARTLHHIGDNQSRIDTLMSNIIGQANISANGASWDEAGRDYWNWNTSTRTTAIVLGTMVELQPESELIPNAVRWLMVARSARTWPTTQETAWSIMALTDWMIASGELNADYTWSASLNENEIGAGIADESTLRETTTLIVEVADLLVGELNQLALTRDDGEGNLYYTAYLRNLLPVPEIEPVSNGVTVIRRYSLLDNPGESITSARIGDVVQVRLTVIVPNNMNYVVIEDPIPAGVEPIDPGLLTSQQMGTRPTLERADPLRRGWGWWYFSDIQFYDEKVVLSSSFLPAGTYEYIYTFRPGLEGVYNVIPPIAYEFYFPSVYGRGAGESFTVLPVDQQ